MAKFQNFVWLVGGICRTPSVVSIKLCRGGTKIINVELLKRKVGEGIGDEAREKSCR